MRRPEGEKLLDAVPGPRKFGPFAAQRALFGLARDPIGTLGNLFAEYGPVVSLLRGGGTRVFSSRAECPGTVFVCGPDLLQQIECDATTFHRTPLSGQLYPQGPVSRRRVPLTEWATGLFAVNGDEHRRHRRILSQPFRPGRVSGYLPEILNETEAHLASWREGEQINLHIEMMTLTLAIALRAFFGDDIRANAQIAKAQAKSLRLVLSPGVLMAPFDLPGLPYRSFLNAVIEFNKEMRNLVEKKRRAGGAGEDVLSRLILAARNDPSGLSLGEIVGHASVVFAAGHETSSTALTFALFLISQHPEVYEALHAEIVSEVKSERPSPEELERLPVLDGVVRETLRILPPAPWNARIATCPVEVGGFLLPANAEVVGSILHTHRLRECYAEPRRFIPSRWEKIRPGPFSFNPFGGGARLCPGAAFATMEMKAILVSIVRRFRLAVCPGARVDPIVNITMSLKRGLPMTVERQDGRFVEGARPVGGSINRLVELPSVAR